MSGVVGQVGARSGVIGETESGETGTWTPTFRKGTTVLPIGTTRGYYYKLGGLLYIEFYGFQADTGTNYDGSGRYNVGGLPYAVEGENTAGYPAIRVGYYTLNGGNHGEATPHRMQSNHDPDNKTLTLYGSNHSLDWTTDNFELGGSGILRLL